MKKYTEKVKFIDMELKDKNYEFNKKKIYDSTLMI